nr:unnamed protein product [Haemonchus contortus]
MRFCEPPVSLEAREHLVATVRRFFSMHPEEGILPTRVFLLPHSDREWCADRLQRFDNFHRDPTGSKRKLGRISNAACAALAAINAAGDDRRTHLRDVTLVYPLWHPIRIQFTLTDMASEAGWAPGRHVVLWVVGSPSLVWAKVVTLVNFSDRKQLNLTLEAFPWANHTFLRAIRQNGRDSDGSRVFDACIRLSRANVAANPIYDLVSRLDIFAGLNPYSMGDQVINILCSNQEAGASEQEYLRSLPAPSQEARSFRVNQRTLTLTPDQRDAIRIGASRIPLVAIQAAFGTGKTLVGSLIAALSARTPTTTVIVRHQRTWR